MHRKGKRRHDQHGPCRLSRYHSCSCFRLRVGSDMDLCLCFATWMAAYSSAVSAADVIWYIGGFVHFPPYSVSYHIPYHAVAI